ncbi:S41 family peptidase [Brevundimonas sp.]|uniref:S41 family peptidase n=1 Tax=Brevundimonas sp. TaxID=1871086 RepID=UPI002D6CAF45|nr:S41 family peptidase [Brevundimonas sp.]HYC96485.1 S41 family peptidase [Brevundimonas sp.]
MRTLIFAAMLTGAAIGPAFAQSPAASATQATAEARAPAPRETVAAIAGRIRELYFDPARAEEIAAALEAESAAGAFDALTDPRDLAAALSTRLRPIDAHFNVVHDPRMPEAPPPAAAPQAGPGGPAAVRRPRGPNPAEARSHYGFRKVEILPGNVGYIELRGFSNIDFDDPADPARRAADAALTFVAGTDAVIFDLRDNGGGAPSMVGYLTSAFTPPDAPIYNIFHSREGTESEAPAVFHPTPRLEVPVYVLISGRTGSAGEAFPYTLQGAKRATIVGEASGGAANPGGMVPVGGGFAVFISQGSPKNPNTGGNWEGTGVIPDVAVRWDEALTRAHALALEGIVAADAGRTDAAWALEALTSTAAAGDLSPYAGTYGEQAVTVAGDRLHVIRGRRPPVVLARLDDDLFTVVGDPTRRTRFTRDEAGRVVAMETFGVGGPGGRARRSD